MRAWRAQEIDEGLSGHLAAGGGAEFLTLTTRHFRADALADRLDVVLSALQFIFAGSGWVRRRDRLGYVGSIRAGEITFGRNGWHPHSHTALLFDRPLDPAERADFAGWVDGRWSSRLDRLGLGSINDHGVDLRPITDGEGLSQYLTKVEGGWTAGMELARADAKRKGSTPLDLLRAVVETGDVEPLRLWQEYERATFDKRAIRWSPGLRARLLGSDEECSDVDAAATEGDGLALLRALVSWGEWNRATMSGSAGDLLTRLEQVAGVLLGMTEVLGHPHKPLDVR